MKKTARGMSLVRAGVSVLVTASLGVAGIAATSVAAGGSKARSKGIEVAYFSVGASNTYVQAGINAAQAAGKKLGATVQVFDGQFSATTQVNEIQNALSQKGKFQAFVVEPDSGQVVCSLIKKALAQHIVVTATNGTLCGAATVMPGTAAFVGGQTLASYEAYFKQIAQENRNGGDIAVMTGPALSPNTATMTETLRWFTVHYPRFHVVSNQPGDYTTPTALSLATSVLGAQKHLIAYVSNYSEMTTGIAAAVKQVGYKHIKLYDMGADKWAVSAIRDGQVQESMALLPVQEAAFGVEAAIDAVRHESMTSICARCMAGHPLFFDLTKVPAPVLPGGTPYITKSNVGRFKAEY